jgi:hypothetical protein
MPDRDWEVPLGGLITAAVRAGDGRGLRGGGAG